MNIEQLRKLRAMKIKAMEALNNKAKEELRDFEDGEQKEYEALNNTQKSLKAQIERELELQALDVEMSEPTSEPIINKEIHVSKNIADNQDKDETGFENFGDFVGAIYNQDREKLKNVEYKNASSDTGSEGGFLIPTTFQKQILQHSISESIVRPRATVIPATSGTPDAPIEIPYLDQSNDLNGGVKFHWTNDSDEKKETGEVKLKLMNLTPQEVSGTWTVPNKMLRNISALSPLMMKLFGRAYIAQENQVFLFGDGVGKPKGIFNSKALAQVTRKTAKKIAYEDILAMASKRVPNENGYVWLLTLDTEAELAKLQDGDGQFILKTSAKEDFSKILHGMSEIVNGYSPSLGNVNDLALLDFSKYIIKDGAGMMIDVSSHAEFKKSQTVFRFINNLDADTWVQNKIKLNNKLEVSPFIALK